MFWPVFVVAEIIIFPSDLLLVDLGDITVFGVGKVVARAHPHDATNIRPTHHVRAINEEDILIRGLEKVPSLIVQAAHVGVVDINRFALLDVWELPSLAIVFRGAVNDVQVIAVGVRPAGRLNWALRADGLGTPLAIINEVHGVDVLAIIAVPERVLAAVLPPLPFEACERGIWIDLWERTLPGDRREMNAFVVHSAREELVTYRRLVGDSTRCSAILEVEFFRCGVSFEHFVATLLTHRALPEVRVHGCLGK